MDIYTEMYENVRNCKSNSFKEPSLSHSSMIKSLSATITEMQIQCNEQKCKTPQKLCLLHYLKFQWLMQNQQYTSAHKCICNVFENYTNGDANDNESSTDVPKEIYWALIQLHSPSGIENDDNNNENKPDNAIEIKNPFSSNNEKREQFIKMLYNSYSTDPESLFFIADTYNKLQMYEKSLKFSKQCYTKLRHPSANISSIDLNVSNISRTSPIRTMSMNPTLIQGAENNELKTKVTKLITRNLVDSYESCSNDDNLSIIVCLIDLIEWKYNDINEKQLQTAIEEIWERIEYLLGSYEENYEQKHWPKIKEILNIVPATIPLSIQLLNVMSEIILQYEKYLFGVQYFTRLYREYKTYSKLTRNCSRIYTTFSSFDVLCLHRAKCSFYLNDEQQTNQDIEFVNECLSVNNEQCVTIHNLEQFTIEFTPKVENQNHLIEVPTIVNGSNGVNVTLSIDQTGNQNNDKCNTNLLVLFDDEKKQKEEENKSQLIDIPFDVNASFANVPVEEKTSVVNKKKAKGTSGNTHETDEEFEHHAEGDFRGGSDTSVVASDSTAPSTEPDDWFNQEIIEQMSLKFQKQQQQIDNLRYEHLDRESELQFEIRKLKKEITERDDAIFELRMGEQEYVEQIQELENELNMACDKTKDKPPETRNSKLMALQPDLNDDSDSETESANDADADEKEEPVAADANKKARFVIVNKIDANERNKNRSNVDKINESKVNIDEETKTKTELKESTRSFNRLQILMILIIVIFAIVAFKEFSANN